MTQQFQLDYIKQKQKEKNDQQKKVRGGVDFANSKLDAKQGIGFGIGYCVDMSDAMQKVNQFQYQPTEDQIHYRRYTSGQYIDGPPSKRTE